jgi:hypothetical protein
MKLSTFWEAIMSSNLIECYGEGGFFPDNEFTLDDQGNLIHNKGIPHYITGIPVGNQPSIPGPGGGGGGAPPWIGTLPMEDPGDPALD